MAADVFPLDGELGPAMQVLPERQRKFVLAYISLGQNGFRNNALAAREAGYTGTPGALRVTGHRLSHDPNIQAAIMEEAKKRVCLAAAVVATPVLADIAMDKDIPAQHRIRAAIALADRGGMPAVSEQRVSVEHSVNREKMEELVGRLAAEIGVDPAKLIGVNRAAAPLLELKATEVRREPATDA
jgi:phage terminase small subunit